MTSYLYDTIDRLKGNHKHKPEEFLAIEPNPDDTFRIWRQAWKEEQPARPSPALAEHGIHFPDFDRMLWEYIVLPRLLYSQVPASKDIPNGSSSHPASLEKTGYIDKALTSGRPSAFGFYWPSQENANTSVQESIPERNKVFLIYSSERTDVIRLWIDSAVQKMSEFFRQMRRSNINNTNKTHHSHNNNDGDDGNNCAFKEEIIELYTFPEFVEKNMIDDPKPDSNCNKELSYQLVLIRPEDSSHHARYKNQLLQLREQFRSFYGRVPPRPDRLTFLRHIARQIKERPNYLHFYGTSSGRHHRPGYTIDLDKELSDKVLRKIAGETCFFHYSDLARIFLRTIESFQRDILCDRYNSPLLEERLHIAFDENNGRNNQKRALVDSRRENTHALDVFFAMPHPDAGRGINQNTILDDEKNVVTLMEEHRKSLIRELHIQREIRSTSATQNDEAPAKKRARNGAVIKTTSFAPPTPTPPSNTNDKITGISKEDRKASNFNSGNLSFSGPKTRDKRF